MIRMILQIYDVILQNTVNISLADSDKSTNLSLTDLQFITRRDSRHHTH